MKEMDGTKVRHEALEEIRIRAVKSVEACANPEVVIEALGFHRSSIFKWGSLADSVGDGLSRAALIAWNPNVFV